ncbi:actin-related protein [Mucidula mucida]|nr:actin-related protein [Mucidula mucida]
MAFHDSTVVILETGKDVLRAGLGLFDLLKTPTVEIQARVGLRSTASNGDVLNGANGETQPSSSRAPSQPPPTAGPNEYLVGTQLDEALAAGLNVAVYWPFQDHPITQWAQVEALWKYVLFNQLQRRRAQNESPVLLSIPPGQPRSAYEKMCQIFFERFNCAGLAIVERPMAQIYAVNSLSGVVSILLHEDLRRHKTLRGIPANLLRANQGVMAALSPADAPLSAEDLQQTLLDLAKFVWTSGYVKVPSSGETALVEDEGILTLPQLSWLEKRKLSLKVGNRSFGSYYHPISRASLTLGKERHRFCEPLFDPTLLNALSDPDAVVSPLQDAVGHAVMNVDVDQRQYVWRGLLVTGDLTKPVKGLGVAMQSRLAPFLHSPDLATEIQPKSVHVLGIPEYYPEYRDTGDGYAAFLGSSITAKIIFNDNSSRSYVSKSEYTNKGPHSIIECSPALL